MISIAGITVTQIYWVRKAFDIRENQFNRDTKTALGNVARYIFETNQLPVGSNNPVRQVSSNYFIVQVNGPIDASILELLLVTEFEKRNIDADFEYGIYDCVENCMVGGNYISPRKVKSVSQFPETPKFPSDTYYFAVQFPHLEANIVSQMGIWGFSSAVTLVVILFFGYTLFVILKQRRLSEVQKDFINNMTHEFKTPISTIAISAEVLKNPAILTTPDRLLSYATIIQTENQRLKLQVERVLQMAELDQEDIGLTLETFDLHELIRDSVASRSLSLEGKILLDLKATSSMVLADKLHLTNVIHNLLDNGIKYNQSVPSLNVSTRTLGSHQLELSVEDNGIGIAPHEQSRIFDKFYRVSTGNVHDVKGFGLGLNYVQRIVEKHRGQITVMSSIGKGSTFRVVLPFLHATDI